MGSIVIIEEKVNKMVDKLEKIKDCAEDMIVCLSEHMSKGGAPYEDDDDENWDDEYEVKRRASRRGIRGRSSRY